MSSLFKGAKDIMDGMIGGAQSAIEDKQKERKENELKMAIALVVEESKEAGHCLCCSHGGSGAGANKLKEEE